MKKRLLAYLMILAGVFSVLPSGNVVAEPFLGEIRMFAGNFAPRGWALCDGQLLPISQYSSLFSILGTTYGGDGRTTFALPDLRGRVPVHAGDSTGPGLTRRYWGNKGGTETETLTVNQIPSHSHTLFASSEGADQVSPEDGTLAAKVRTKNYNAEEPDVNMRAESIENTGGGQAHNNMPPFACVNFIISLQGTFPSRN